MYFNFSERFILRFCHVLLGASFSSECWFAWQTVHFKFLCWCIREIQNEQFLKNFPSYQWNKDCVYCIIFINRYIFYRVLCIHTLMMIFFYYYWSHCIFYFALSSCFYLWCTCVCFYDFIMLFNLLASISLFCCLDIYLIHFNI